MDRIDRPKQTKFQFFAKELVVFVSQILVFFVVAVLTSSFLSNEQALTEFASTKINDGSLKELLLTFVAIFFVVGCFTTIQRLTDSEVINDFIDEVLFEIPKTIYFFGSSLSGVMLAISMFLLFDESNEGSTEKYFAVTIVFAIMAFIYGSTLSYKLKKKTHILSYETNKKFKSDSQRSAP
ncbi:hypothetical protein [Vibrio agarivorans]|uniref:hypothetical protein n=1 Tax=Vibrio agarivorans TaxID=153622 RepID=UPI0022321662|nr:hypothetical protein [Vibrio agarivorans]